MSQQMSPQTSQEASQEMSNQASQNLARDYQTFTLSIEHEIAHICLNRPEHLNSMITEFWHELPTCVYAIDQHSAARVIVISSTGKHFSAGMDLSVFANMQQSFKGEAGRVAEHMRRHVAKLQAAFTALEKVRIPVLAAIQGGAIGGAVDMVSACDSRYCTADAYFCIKETQLGLTADVGTLQRLPHLLSHGIVRELAFTGRNMDSHEALQHGFVNQVFDDQVSMLNAVMKIAKQIALNSPLAVAGSKEMLNYARDHSVDDSLNYMATWQSGMLQMHDIQEAMAAGKEKRLPKFEALRQYK